MFNYRLMNHSAFETSYCYVLASFIKAPRECIDYVILHELCHLAEHNHSDRFWRLLTQVMPNWAKVKTQLDGMAELYLSGV